MTEQDELPISLGFGHCPTCRGSARPTYSQQDKLAHCPHHGIPLLAPAEPGQIIAKGSVWNHKRLCRDLAGHLFSDGYITSETRYGSAWMSNAPIPDVLKIRKSYTRCDVQTFEVKVSRSDFLADIRKGKYLGYLNRSTRLSFATPADGVVNDPDEIPEACGWLARGPTGWRVRRPPKIRDVKPSYEEALAVLMAEHSRAQGLERDLEAERKRKHRHNVRKNSVMHARLDRYERDVRERAESRQRLHGALETLRRLTGLSLDRWGYAHDLERWVERQRGGGVTARDLSSIATNAKEIVDRIADIRKQAGEPAEEGASKNGYPG